MGKSLEMVYAGKISVGILRLRLEADGKKIRFFLIFKNTFNDRKSERPVIVNFPTKPGSVEVAV